MKIGLELFDTTLKKEWDLLIILRTVDRWFSTEELREKLDVTPAFLQKLISSLTESMDAFGKDELELIVSKGRGIRLQTKSPNADPRNLLIFLTEETMGFMLFKAILNENFGSTQKFAYEHFISDATVRRLLNKFRDAIKPYGIKISRSNAAIEGKESQVRLFINTALWKIYAGKGWPFEGINEQYIEFLAKSLIKEGNLRLTALQTRQLMYQLAVAMLRRRNHRYVEFDPAWSEILDNNKAFLLFKKKNSPVLHNIQSISSRRNCFPLSFTHHSKRKFTNLATASNQFFREQKKIIVPCIKLQKHSIKKSITRSNQFLRTNRNYF
ncbi:mga helix-turn-helix domain-containing protein [Listeria floridensis FSL S10-1187]|uniref:Mga helix-turn-helix domain-containing protein n=1 Tax=Listeria floridensis FSL S10-1187 TaxID=1265817 RepID=A0ABN0RIU8_9LIST|nr:helix-turn-helix domain-containing protein [Listeria floridensis]EUJ33816.1 mga helix-turn-helix domain-containing protein [Listeria floridensis FSL S10-1187]